MVYQINAQCISSTNSRNVNFPVSCRNKLPCVIVGQSDSESVWLDVELFDAEIETPLRSIAVTRECNNTRNNVLMRVN